MFCQIVVVFVVLIVGVVFVVVYVMFVQLLIFGVYYLGGLVECYLVLSILVECLIYLFYVFFIIEDGCCMIGVEVLKNFVVLVEFKKVYLYLCMLILIGGWGVGGFFDVVLIEVSCKCLVDFCMVLFFECYVGSFDGVDIDWEFLVSGGLKELVYCLQDCVNLIWFVQVFCVVLDVWGCKVGQLMLLIVVLVVGCLQIDGFYDLVVSYDLLVLVKVFDFINLMSYDMGIGFLLVLIFNVLLYEVLVDLLVLELCCWNNVVGVVQYYCEYGVLVDKLVLGVLFYGCGFKVIGDVLDGFY